MVTDGSLVKPSDQSLGAAPKEKKTTQSLLALGSKKGDRAFKKEAKRQRKLEKHSPKRPKVNKPAPPATNAKPAGGFYERGAGRRVGIDTVAVRFDGSVPWTPNVIEIPAFGEEEGFSNEEKRSLVSPVFWCRQLILAVAFAVSALVMKTNTERLFVLCVLLTMGLPVAVIVRSRIKRQNELPPWMLFADSAVAVGLAVVSPSHFFLAIILVAFQLVVGGMTFAPVQAGAATVMAFFGLAAARAFTDDLGAGDLVMLGTVAILVPAVSVLSQRLRTTERQIHRKYLDLLGGLEAVAWEADPETLCLTAVSPQVSNMFGFDQVRFLRSWREMIHPDDQELEEASRFDAVRSGAHSVAVEFRMVDAEGITRHIRNTIAVERDRTKRITRVRGVFSDVTAAHEAETTIRKQAQYDSLTGLPNRSLFNDQLQRRLADARANNETLSVHLLDLNGFKEVNDTLGHGVGDVLLQQISGRLAAYLPDRSFVARLGGDEFAVVTYPSNLQSAQAVAEAIGASLQPPITVDDMTIQAGAAIGVSMFPADGDSPAVLLRRADAAMYEAKQAGQLYVFAMPDDDESNVRRLQLLGELRASIASGDFQLFHQPKLDALSGQIVGTEGLIRWNHKQFGLLTPIAFVELSELSGLIQPLTRWIIEQGIRDLADWRQRGYSITVALNLSVRNFFDHDLPEFIASLLNQYKVPGSSLVLEITESEVMADRAIARKALEAFRSLGVKISIDDFGTGFSSLSQLQLMPIDEIKVDQSFVSGMLTSEQDYVIVRSIIDLAHNLSLEVVAEGAETLEQLRALRSLNADRIQGYVIGKPMPVDRFLDWMGSLETVTLADGRHRARVPASYLGVTEAEIPLQAGRPKATILAGTPAWAPPFLPDRSEELVGAGAGGGTGTGVAIGVGVGVGMSVGVTGLTSVFAGGPTQEQPASTQPAWTQPASTQPALEQSRPNPPVMAVVSSAERVSSGLGLFAVQPIPAPTQSNPTFAPIPHLAVHLAVHPAPILHPAAHPAPIPHPAVHPAPILHPAVHGAAPQFAAPLTNASLSPSTPSGAFLPPVMSESAANNNPTQRGGSTSWLPLRVPATSEVSQSSQPGVTAAALGLPQAIVQTHSLAEAGPLETSRAAPPTAASIVPIEPAPTRSTLIPAAPPTNLPPLIPTLTSPALLTTKSLLSDTALAADASPLPSDQHAQTAHAQAPVTKRNPFAAQR